MRTSRRTFLKCAALAAGGATLGAGELYATRATDRYPRAGDPSFTPLAEAALDAARAAGASYADVRFTLTRMEELSVDDTTIDDEQGIVGVRAFVEGGWGFAAGPVWSIDAVARLGREAAQQARQVSKARRHPLEMTDDPPVAHGTWVMPVKIDPFTVSTTEKLSLMQSWIELVSRRTEVVGLHGYSIDCKIRFQRQEQTLATTAGSFVTQTRFVTVPSIILGGPSYQAPVVRTFDALHPTAQGWEIFTPPELAPRFVETIEDIAWHMKNRKRIEVDRYDIVFDGAAMGQLMGKSVGIAAEIDRMLGYEANAGGTSYLSPVEDVLGSYAIGNPLLNVSANRTMQGGLATTKWDDEAVAPVQYSVVHEGVFVEGHSSRATVAELAPVSKKLGRTIQSRGCLSSQSALFPPLVQPPNLSMAHGADDTTLEDLVSGLDRGLLVVGGVPRLGYDNLSLDRQQLSGVFNGNAVYEIRNGKRVKSIIGEEIWIKTPELWKSLYRLGGKQSQVTSAVLTNKGEPRQSQMFSVTAPAARVNQIAVADGYRKP